jgi:homoserine O-acetyltransferase/O-succinyltransferase
LAHRPQAVVQEEVVKKLALVGLCLIALVPAARSADYPKPAAGDFVFKDFHLAGGDTLAEARIHYRTLGKPQADAQGVVRNAVLVLHGTTGQSGNFLRPDFAGELFGKDQPLDAERYFIVIPDNLGHGKSTKPSDGLRGRFPKYGYNDMIAAQHRLLTEGLKVNHLRLVVGTSMGGMHSWVWGQKYPEFMDALVPLASLPGPISGRNRMWRKTLIDAIRTDPQWKNGEYTTQPPSLRIATEMLFLMGSNPVQRQKDAPTLEQADKVLAKAVAAGLKNRDANDILYAVEASYDYDPGPGLTKIRAPLLAINFADDLINPPELGILEREIKKVPHGNAILVPMSDQTRGHGTHTLAAVWKHHLVAFLKATEAGK